MVDLANNLTNAPNGKRIALVIGVNEADNSSLPPLNYASKDAEAIAEVLQQRCGFELLVPPLVNEKATSAEVKRAMLKLARDRTDEDFLLLYFSGHGLPMTIEAERRDVYLLTHDFNEDEVKDDENLHLSMRWLRDRLYIPTQAGRVLVILDCCYAGDIGRIADDPYLKELKERINYYFGAPGYESGARNGGLRYALTATGHNALATEKDGHGLMTGRLLSALRGEVNDVLEIENQGQISIQRLHRYLEITMQEQKPGLSGDSAGRDCILTSYPDRAAQLRIKPSRPSGAHRPDNYIPFPRNPLFQPRPGEFERLEHLLFNPETQQKPARLGLVGVVGMGGVGKTQLAVELAYRYMDRFPSGVFWMPATGNTVFDWQRQFAELAFNAGYLPPDDDISNPENESRRARHFCRYLAQHTDALLILDNVEDPNLVMTALPALAGGEVACPILYTSRITQRPLGATTHPVEQLPEEGALRLLLESTRPALLSEILAGSQDAEAKAARSVCQSVGYLPLALVHLHGLLARDQKVTLVRLAEVLKQRGVLDVAKTQQGDAAPLFATFWLSWEKVQNEAAQRLFKLACYFPEATPIPLWLLGLASGLGESGDIFEPLGEALLQLQELSLVEELSGDQVRLHPLVREFGRRLVAEDDIKGKVLLEDAGERLASEFTDLNALERRALQQNYWFCLEQIRSAHEYTKLLRTEKAEQLGRIARWLDRESYLLGNEEFWPQKLPGLFYQQLFNWSVEEGHPLIAKGAPVRWLRQEDQVGAEDKSLLRVFAGHTGAVMCVVFLSDGAQVLTGSADETVRLWETVSGKLLAILKLEGHMGAVTSIAFSSDGTQVLTGSEDQTARLWEIASRKVLVILKGHADSVTSVAFSPDGSKALTGSYGGRACLWETASGKLLRTLEGHTRNVTSSAFSPDGSKVLTGSSDRIARIWETISGNLLMMLEGHTDMIESVAFSPDGSKALTGSLDGRACLWETTSGKLLRTLKDKTMGVWSVAFSPDGTKVVAGSFDQRVRLWETTHGGLLAKLGGHSDIVTSVTFSPDGSKLLTGSEDRTARLWETASGNRLTALEGHTYEIESVAFSPDGTKLLTSSVDRTIRLWETLSGKTLAVLEDYEDLVWSVALSPDGSKLLTGSEDRTARLWETASGKQLAMLEGHTNGVTSVAFSPDGRKILTSSDDGTGRLWETASGKRLVTLEGHTQRVTSGVFSLDGRKILTGSWDGKVGLWETVSGNLLTMWEAHPLVESVAFSPDGTKILAGSLDGIILLLDTTNGRKLAVLQSNIREITGVVFSPNGRLVMAYDRHGNVPLWRADGPEIGSLLGIYVTAYEVGAVHWQDASHVILADKGGPRYRPHFYRLKLEGKW